MKVLSNFWIVRGNQNSGINWFGSQKKKAGVKLEKRQIQCWDTQTRVKRQEMGKGGKMEGRKLPVLSNVLKDGGITSLKGGREPFGMI